jgi:hypothetical protein
VDFCIFCLLEVLNSGDKKAAELGWRLSGCLCLSGI